MKKMSVTDALRHVMEEESGKMIDKDEIHMIREKESFNDLIKGEKILPES